MVSQKMQYRGRIKILTKQKLADASSTKAPTYNFQLICNANTAYDGI